MKILNIDNFKTALQNDYILTKQSWGNGILFDEERNNTNVPIDVAFMVMAGDRSKTYALNSGMLLAKKKKVQGFTKNLLAKRQNTCLRQQQL